MTMTITSVLSQYILSWCRENSSLWQFHLGHVFFFKCKLDKPQYTSWMVYTETVWLNERKKKRNQWTLNTGCMANIENKINSQTGAINFLSFWLGLITRLNARYESYTIANGLHPSRHTMMNVSIALHSLCRRNIIHFTTQKSTLKWNSTD